MIPRIAPLLLALTLAWLASSAATFAALVAPDHAELLYSGRRVIEPEQARFAYSGARVRIAFRGASLGVRLAAERPGVHVNLHLDGRRVQKIALTPAPALYPLVANLDPAKVHTVEIVQATEGFIGATIFHGFVLPEGATVVPWPDPESRRILFIGDSITCGYGIEASGADQPFRPEEENFCLGYAALAARALRADYEVVARSGIGLYRNYGGPVEGNADNLPALFDRVFFRHAAPVWDHAAFSPDVICLNLGTNDFSGKNHDENAFEAAGTRFVNRLLALHPRARILLLSGPMQNGEALRLRLAAVRDATDPTRVGLFALSPQGSRGFGAHYHPSALQAEHNAAELVAHLAAWMAWPVGP
jgi:lysophospholipase L1-like esterase